MITSNRELTLTQKGGKLLSPSWTPPICWAFWCNEWHTQTVFRFDCGSQEADRPREKRWYVVKPYKDLKDVITALVHSSLVILIERWNRLSKLDTSRLENFGILSRRSTIPSASRVPDQPKSTLHMKELLDRSCVWPSSQNCNSL